MACFQVKQTTKENNLYLHSLLKICSSSPKHRCEAITHWSNNDLLSHVLCVVPQPYATKDPVYYFKDTLKLSNGDCSFKRKTFWPFLPSYCIFHMFQSPYHYFHHWSENFPAAVKRKLTAMLSCGWQKTLLCTWERGEGSTDKMRSCFFSLHWPILIPEVWSFMYWLPMVSALAMWTSLGIWSSFVTFWIT